MGWFKKALDKITRQQKEEFDDYILDKAFDEFNRKRKARAVLEYFKKKKRRRSR